MQGKNLESKVWEFQYSRYTVCHKRKDKERRKSKMEWENDGGKKGEKPQF